MLKITGLDNLKKQFDDAQRVFKALDGHLAAVSFDPDNPASIQAAIQSMEAALDDKIAKYRGTAFVESILPQLKEKYRAAILERANGAKSEQ